MRKGSLNFGFWLVCLLLTLSCATEPGSGTPVAGGAITRFTYNTGTVDVIISYERTRGNGQIIAAAVLFDTNPETGQRTKATELEEGVTVTWPEAVSFTIPACATSPTLTSTETFTTFKIFNYAYPESCSSSSSSIENISGLATLLVSKDGTSKTLNGNGNSGEGSGGGGPLTFNTIFVTSNLTDANLGGLSGADTFCATQAASGTNTNLLSGTWRAVMAETGINATDRLQLIPGAPIKDTLGNTIASDSVEFWSGSISNPVAYDENGAAVIDAVKVWTGSTPTGGFDGRDCGGWNVTFGLGLAGQYGLTNGDWLSDVPTDPCNSFFHLYCLNSDE